jgi:glycosyltransferase involved in cell wall biosynthesis
VGFLKKNDFDIVMSWDTKTAFWTLLWSPFFSFTFINATIRHGLRKRKISHYWRSLIAHLSPFVVANSKAGLLTNGLRLDPNKNAVVYNGIDVEILCQNLKKDKRNFFREVFGLDKGEQTVLFISVANLLPYKDYPTLLDALAGLKNELDFYYLIIGEGPMRTWIENRIQALDLQSRVKLVGRIHNVAHYMGNADLFIHSSESEGCSNAIMEAMTLNLPVVATGVGGTPEIIFEKTCRLFEFGNKMQLLDQLRSSTKLIHDSETFLPEYQQYCKRFSNDRMVEEFYGIFVKCLRGTIKP